MMPALSGIDHIHVFVADRSQAQAWYADTLGLTPVAALASWSKDPKGPLIIADTSRSVCLSLFERQPERCRSTIALGVTAGAFLQWRTHLQRHLETPPKLVDHQLSWSLYFSDPDGNPFEITCYDYATLAADLATG
ncbi:hypothetical protein GY26_20420 [Gammaproteobacteria bacterium MFB021]|nr:hypothetical protein GY26_20420 [Gammaproteobacteria bacterium MFB021]